MSHAEKKSKSVSKSDNEENKEATPVASSSEEIPRIKSPDQEENAPNVPDTTECEFKRPIDPVSDKNVASTSKSQKKKVSGPDEPYQIGYNNRCLNLFNAMNVQYKVPKILAALISTNWTPEDRQLEHSSDDPPPNELFSENNQRIESSNTEVKLLILAFRDMRKDLKDSIVRSNNS